MPELELDMPLSAVARAHSQDMAARGYFSHETPEGLDPTDRAQSMGYECRRKHGRRILVGIGENLSKANLFGLATRHYGVRKSPDGRETCIEIGVTYDWHTATELATGAVKGWMNSPGHRQNMLTPHYEREGIGVALTVDCVYVTQNLI